MAGEMQLVQSSVPNKPIYGSNVYNCDCISYATVFTCYGRNAKSRPAELSGLSAAGLSTQVRVFPISHKNDLSQPFSSCKHSKSSGV